MKKKLLSFALSLALCLALLPGTALAAPSGWAAEEVNAAAQAGLTTPSVTQNYQASITRGQFCELVVKLYEKLTGETAQAGANPFSDTANPEIVKAYTLGIVKGLSETSFAPDNPINRQEICVMLSRCIDLAIPGSNVAVYRDNGFADKSAIAVWASGAVNYAFDNSIIRGVGGNKVDPLGNTTCEQAILLVYRIYVNQQNLVTDPSAVEADQALRKLVGTYIGGYLPSNGESAVTFRIYKENGSYKAYGESGSLPGKSNIKDSSGYWNVSYDTLSKTYLLEPDEPVVLPEGYSMLTFRGTLEGDVLSGTAPTAFRISRAVTDIRQKLDEAVGTYTGTYFNNTGEVGLTLTIAKDNGSYKAFFDFKNLPGQSNSKEGSYYMHVDYSYLDDIYTLTGYEWVDQPGGYVFADLKGPITGGTFSGDTPTQFRVVKAG